MLKYLLTQFSPTLLVATLLLASFLVQQEADPLLFLPAGLQLIAAFVYGARCLPGCAVGMAVGVALVSGQSMENETTLAWISYGLYGVLSTLCLLGLVALVCRLNKVDDDLAGLAYKHVLVVVVMQALLDAGLRLWLVTGAPYAEQGDLVQWLALATGNLLGSMSLVLSLFVLAATFSRRSGYIAHPESSEKP